MEFNLTSSQKIFYTKNFDDSIWTQGVLQVFPQVYSYRELNDAFNKLVKYNESLLINIKEKDGQPIADLGEFSYTEYPYFECESQKDAIDYFRKFLKTPIKINQRLVNCIVFRTPNSSGIMVNAHHIIVDAFSAFVMAKRIESYLNKTEESMPPYQSYEDYIGSEIKYKNSKRYLTDRNFWLKEFETNPVTKIFPSTSENFNYKAADMDLLFPEALFEEIKRVCDFSDVSIGSFLNAVYATYIHKKYDITNFSLGVPVLNRTTPAELNTVGLYMNIVPLVLNLDLSKSFLENAQKIDDSQMNLLRHQRFSQNDIKELLTGRGYDQLFDIGADYEDLESADGYEAVLYYSEAISVPMEIHFFNTNDKNRKIKIRYRTSMFTEKEIQTMMNSIIAIAEDAVSYPNKKLGGLRMVSDNDLKMLKSFNNTDHKYTIPSDSTLYSLFEKTVEDNTNKICLKTAERDMTFGEILAVSENLDSEIRNITDNKKSVIAVIAERSPEMYCAVYGIIRGGNAYLPIDPNYPSDRIEYILSNSNAAAVVCQEKFNHLAGKVPCINMTDFIKNTKKAENVLPCCADKNDTAYVIYTSGSTGNPKGAKVSHKSAVNRIMWMHDKYPLGAEDVILQKTPYTFDVSVWELFWWGMVGGSLAASRPDEHFLPDKILSETQKNKVTHIHFVPSVFEIFLNYLESHKDEIEKFSSVKYVFLSGEALSASLVQRFFRLYDFNKVTLHNLYGPTECAVDVTYYDCRPEDTDPIPIGKPIYNTQMHVVDKYMNLVPVGVQGELCIAGMNVGQGYLNNESLTNEKFIDNPFGDGKLYKTGDLGYWEEDGNIIFIGRNDFQVKIHGQRIELGEIENAVSSVEGITLSVAVVREDRQGRQFICVFYTGEEKSAKVIKENISGSLPKYMIPNVFVYLSEIPLTSSGKIDRKSLPFVDLENIETTSEYTAPETEREKVLSECISVVLGIEKMSMSDNFFDIGGDSIKAIYLVSELEEAGYEIHVADIMQNDTLLDIAASMKSTDAKAVYEQNEVNGFIPYSPIMRTFIKENGTIPKDFVHNCVIAADCDADTARKAFDVIVARHDMLRGTLSDNGIEIHSAAERDAYSFEQADIADTNEAINYLSRRSVEGDNLVNVVFCTTEEGNLIAITVHHFLIDLVSWEILMKDFKMAVEQIKKGEEITLPAKTASFIQWSEELDSYAKTIADEIRNYWKNIDSRLDSAMPLCSENDKENEAELYSHTFSKAFSDKIINDANTAYGTRANEILLTALGLAASRITNGSVGIIVEGYGRTELQKPISLDRTVGWFTTCYPVVFEKDADETESLTETKETMRRIPKTGIDYLLLREGFHKNTDIIFNYYRNEANDDENELVSFNSGTAGFSGKSSVDCSVINGILAVNVVVPKCRHEKNLAQRLTEEFVRYTEKLVSICTASDEVVKTRSDFSDSELTEEEFNELKDLFDWTDIDEE